MNGDSVRTAVFITATEPEPRRYGKPVGLNAVIDPAVVGGLRVQIADDVIDASVAARLTDLRQRLAG